MESAQPCFAIALLCRLCRAITRPALSLTLGRRLGATRHGVLQSVAHLCSFVAAGTFGRHSDAAGPEAAIVAAAACGVMAHVSLVVGVSASFTSLMCVGRVAQTISADAIAVPMKAMAAERRCGNVGGGSRAASVGLLQGGTGLGFALGSLVGGTLASLGTVVPLLAALGCAMANLAFGIRLQRGRSAHSNGDAAADSRRRPGAQQVQLHHSLFSSRAVLLLLLRFLNGVSLSIALTSFEMALQAALGWSALRIGQMLAATGAMNALASVHLVPRLHRLATEPVLLCGGFVTLAVGRALQAAAMIAAPAPAPIPSHASFGAAIVALALGQCLVAVGGATSTTLLVTLTAQAAPNGYTGQLIGLSDSFDGIGAVVGPIASGILLDAFGPSAPSAAASTLCLVGGAMSGCILARMGMRTSASVTQSKKGA